MHPDVIPWSVPAQIEVEFNPRIVKFAGRVTFAGRARSFMDSVKLVAEVIFTGGLLSFMESVRLVAELFVNLAPGPCHQVLKLMRFIANVARPKNSKLRSIFIFSGEESGSSTNAFAISPVMSAPVFGSIFPGLKSGRSPSEFHTTTLMNDVSTAGAPLSARVTKSRHTLRQLTEWILVESIRECNVIDCVCDPCRHISTRLGTQNTLINHPPSHVTYLIRREEESLTIISSWPTSLQLDLA